MTETNPAVLAKRYIRDIIQNNYKKPKCYRESGCVYEASLESFVCPRCIEWITINDFYQKVLSKV